MKSLLRYGLMLVECTKYEIKGMTLHGARASKAIKLPQNLAAWLMKHNTPATLSKDKISIQPIFDNLFRFLFLLRAVEFIAPF